MPDGSVPVPAPDRAVGMEFYFSGTPGVDARLKTTPDSFRVREVSNYPRPAPDGTFTILRVESSGWEQHELADAIGRRLGLPHRALAWSGTKDRRAVAERLFSYRGTPPLGPIDLDHVTVLDAYTAREGLVLGQHYANSFEIRADGIEEPGGAVASFRTTEGALRAAGGFPNFFGPQRFGEVRPVTHDVGRAIVRGDLAGAVDLYLTGVAPGETDGRGAEARTRYGEHRDPVRGLREFPGAYRFERSILERLARGATPEQAIRALPFELRRLFVHAYQSYLFNRLLSARFARRLPLDRPVPGDRIVRLGRDGTVRSREAAEVAAENLPECADLVARGRAYVAGPLLGRDAFPRTGEPGELVEALAVGERIDERSFDVPAAPELASPGAWRPLLLPVPPLGLRLDGTSVWFRFSLPKGAYATVLLREFLKGGAPNGGPPTTRD